MTNSWDYFRPRNDGHLLAAISPPERHLYPGLPPNRTNLALLRVEDMMQPIHLSAAHAQAAIELHQIQVAYLCLFLAVLPRLFVRLLQCCCPRPTQRPSGGPLPSSSRGVGQVAGEPVGYFWSSMEPVRKEVTRLMHAFKRATATLKACKLNFVAKCIRCTRPVNGGWLRVIDVGGGADFYAVLVMTHGGRGPGR